MSDRVLIIGGGLSGLATAYHLSRYAIPCTIIEKSHRTGGLIKTDFIDGCYLEAGPDSYIATKPAVSELAEELPGLKEQIIGSNDAARRIFHGPGIENFDAQISKTVRLGEFKSLDIRVEAFNVFNHAQFYGPTSVDGEINDSNFGRIVSAAAPRLVQLALKFHF